MYENLSNLNLLCTWKLTWNLLQKYSFSEPLVLQLLKNQANASNKIFLEPNWFKGFSDKTKIFTQSKGLLFHSESYYIEENLHPIIAAHIRIELGLMGSYSIPLF